MAGGSHIGQGRAKRRDWDCGDRAGQEGRGWKVGDEEFRMGRNLGEGAELSWDKVGGRDRSDI